MSGEIRDPSGDTIVALSTPPGRSALAIIRLSGPDAIEVVDRRFRGRDALARSGGNTLHVGWVFDGDESPLDEVVVGLFRAPSSYTGEDVVEVTTHGNPLLVARIVEAFQAIGVRMAEPGEFTRRAFLNGKLDLSQAEAVAALIHARSEVAARAALRQLGGELSSSVRRERERLLHVLARLEARLDFPDQDLEAFDAEGERPTLLEAAAALARLVDRSRRGRRLAEAGTVAIVGRPNVGKSSLFNALVGRDRAIVHDRPGTTRDAVDFEVVLGGVSLRLVDTAGLTETRDDVEAEGVRRSRQAIEHADMVLLVLDATAETLTDAEATLGRGDRALVVANKVDLGWRLRPTDALGGSSILGVSALRGDGLKELEDSLGRSVGEGDAREDVLVVGLRQERALERSAAAAAEAERLMRAESPPLEIVAEELRNAANALGEITGERVGDDLLDVLFSEFCIGK